MATKDLDRFPRGPAVAAASGIAFFGLGVAGFSEQGATVPDAVYRSAQLFVLGVDLTDPPLVLQVARFGAMLVSAYALIALVSTLLHRRLQLFAAARRTGHVVVIGAGPEVPALAGASGYGGSHSRVVVVGDVSDEAEAELSTQGVPVWRGLSDKHLARVLHGAAEVAIVGERDDESVRQLARVRATAPELRPYVLFDSLDLTRQWIREPASTVRPVCRVTQVALATLRACPPFPSECAVPDPLVVGDGDLAAEITRRIVAGWQRDGWRPRVHVLTDDGAWVEEVEAEVGSGVLEVAPTRCLSPRRVRDVARDITDAWPKPPAKKATPGGVRVYVALGDDTRAVAIARQLVASDADCHVALVVSDAALWREAFASQRDRVHLVSRDRLLGDPAALKLAEADLLRDELLLDAKSWPPESPTLFGRLVRDADGSIARVEANESLRRGVELLTAEDAALARRVLAAGGLTLDRGGRPAAPPLLGPDEVRAMATLLRDSLREVVPADAHPRDVEFWSLEVASRLPAMAARAGWRVRSDADPLLSREDVERLARGVHEEYVVTQQRLGNPSSSDLAHLGWDDLTDLARCSNRAVVEDYPVKLAAFGLSWRRADHPAPFELTSDQVDILAVAEHRRWSHDQRRNGGKAHHLNKPWEELTAGQLELDHDIAQQMTRLLASVGVEVYRSVP